MSDDYTGTFRTRSGVLFDLKDPRPEDVFIEDIAHALSHINRYGGHVGRYSVARHSVLTAEYMHRGSWGREHIRCALMHDAAEAYVGDMIGPLKALVGNAFERIEIRVRDAIWQRYGLGGPPGKGVKHADLVLLASEASVLVPVRGPEWDGLPAPERGIQQAVLAGPAGAAEDAAGFLACARAFGIEDPS